MSATQLQQAIDHHLRKIHTQADPIPMVAEWLDQFFELLHLADTRSPQEAYDLVASWARLWRIPEELIQAVTDRRVGKLDVEKDLWTEVLEVPSPQDREHEQQLRQRLPELAQMAIQVPRPLEWIEELDEFDQRSEEGLAPEADTAWAVDLLEDLDTAELVWWVASRFGGEKAAQLVRKKKRTLGIARAALEDRSYLFVPARQWIVAFAQATQELRAPGFEITLKKIPPLLEMILDFEGGLEPAKSHIEAAKRLVAIAAPQFLYVDSWRSLLRFQVKAAEQRAATVALAAAGAAESWTVDVKHFSWISPDEKWLARVDLPPQLDASSVPERLPLAVQSAEKVGKGYLPISDLVPQEKWQVRLCGVEGTLDDGKVHFSPRQLLEATEKNPQLVFEVWEEGRWVTWHRITEEH